MIKSSRFWTSIILLFFVLGETLVAQIVHVGRYEIKYDWRFENHLVVSNDERGLTLIQTNQETIGKNYKVKFTHLDKNLEEKWVDSTQISSKMKLMGYHYLKDRLFVLFQDFPVKKRIEVLSLDYRTHSITHHKTTQTAELSLSEFEIIGNTALLGGYFDMRPVVYAFDLENDRVNALRGIYKNKSKLLEVKVNKDSITFNVLVGELNEEKDKTVYVNTYDYEGNQIRDYRLETKRNYSLLDGVSSSINDITQVVVGNYGYKSNTLPSGIYINYVNRIGEQNIQYINYSELSSFFSYMKGSRKAKVIEKALEIKLKGKEQRYKLFSLVRELEEVDNKLVFKAEYFKPGGRNRVSSHNVNGSNQGNYARNMEVDAFGNLVQVQINDFDFTHAFGLVLDLQGQVLWNDSFEMDFTLENNLDEHGRFIWVKEKEHLVFAHYDEKEVFAKILNGNDSSEITKSALMVAGEYDKRDELQSTIELTRWYGDLFLVHGIQNVRIKDKSEPAERRFFINAIRLLSEAKQKKND